MLIGLGHDIQIISELEAIQFLGKPGFFFTAKEVDYIKNRKKILESMAGFFSSKEAFFKALPEDVDFFWTDLEILHTKKFSPYFHFYNNLKSFIRQEKLKVQLSISHSGNYVSSVVIITK